MKAYVLKGPGVLTAEEREIPRPGPTEVLIRVTNVGICGSDIHLYKGTYNGPQNYPILFGHEWSGIVEKTGDKVTKVKPGDKVTGDCSRYCGHCDNCSEDRNLCRTIEKFGITIDGASAEYILRDERYLYRADPEADLALLALTEPIAVAKHLLEKILKLGGSYQGKRVLIYGGGAIGQAALLLLRLYYGCEQVDLSDLIEYRTGLARELGANIPPAEALKWELENDYPNMYNRTRYDVVIETTGVAPVFANGLNLLKPGGYLGCVGMIKTAEIPQKLIVTKSLTVTGSIGGTEEFEGVIAFIQENRDAVRKLISHVFPAAETDQAFAMATEASKAMKISIAL